MPSVALLPVCTITSPNNALQLIAGSVRSCVAPAAGSS